MKKPTMDFQELRQGLRQRLTSLHSWELPKQTGALAPEYVWTNRDMGTYFSIVIFHIAVVAFK